MPGPRIRKGATRVHRTLRDYLRMQKKLVRGQQARDMEAGFSALNVLDEFTEELYKEGHVLTADDIIKLKQYYDDALKECNKTMPREGKPETELSVTEKLSRKTYEMLLQDKQMLDNITPDMQLGIAEVLSNARDRIVTLGDGNGRMGGNQSSRVPMSVPTIAGGYTKGVFTPNSNFYDAQQWRTKVLNALKVRYPEFRESIEAFRKSGHMNMGMQMYTFFRNVPPEKESILRAMVAEYSSALMSRQTQIGMYGNQQGIPGGSNIDKRNTAMSVVASLMGTSDILANSSSMKVRIGDTVIEGTFMEAAEGVDMNHIKPDSLYLHATKGTFDNPALLKQLTELQALDFICMNIDRHAGNFFINYEKQPDGKVIATGLKGIDNDCSFGLNSYPDQYGTNRMCGIDSMMVITKDMADRIKSMTKEQLSISLKGLITPAEIEAAWDRLKLVRELMAPAEEPFVPQLGKIQIVDDKDFAKLTLDDLTRPMEQIGVTPRSARSIFSLVKRVREGVPDAFRRVSNAPSNNDPFTEAKVESEGKKINYEEAALKLRQLSDKVEENNKGFFIGSKKYREMNSYAKEAADVFEMLANSTIPEKDKNYIASNVLQVLSEKTRAYLDSKLGVKGGFAKNTRSITRGMGAQELMEFTDQNADMVDLREDLEYRRICASEGDKLQRAMGLKEAGTRIKQINQMKEKGEINPADAKKITDEVTGLYKFVTAIPGGIKTSGLVKADLESSKALLAEYLPKEQVEQRVLHEKKHLDATEKSLMGDKMFPQPRQ